MASMISGALKPAVTRVIDPVARLALRAGLTPNSVTILGAIGVIASAAYFYPKERFFCRNDSYLHLCPQRSLRWNDGTNIG